MQWLGLALVALIPLVAGCGKQQASTTIGSKEDKAFATAPAEIKSAWDKGRAAMGSNDFIGATLTMQKLRAQAGLSGDQRAAIDQAMVAVSDAMYDAANRGDAKAIEAINKLRDLTRR